MPPYLCNIHYPFLKSRLIIAYIDQACNPSLVPDPRFADIIVQVHCFYLSDSVLVSDVWNMGSASSLQVMSCYASSDSESRITLISQYCIDICRTTWGLRKRVRRLSTHAAFIFDARSDIQDSLTITSVDRKQWIAKYTLEQKLTLIGALEPATDDDIPVNDPKVPSFALFSAVYGYFDARRGESCNCTLFICFYAEICRLPERDRTQFRGDRYCTHADH